MKANEMRDVVVKRAFLGRQQDAIRPGPAARELQADRAAPVAHHHFAEQRVQFADVLRRQLILAIDEAALELLCRTQKPRLQKRNQVEKLVKIVLHWRCRQQQDELLAQLAGEFPELRVAIAQMVRLVHDRA